jgi:hypothetical protein
VKTHYSVALAMLAGLGLVLRRSKHDTRKLKRLSIISQKSM